MTDNNRIHKGSLQFYPRVRAKKVLPSANWKPLDSSGSVNFQGFVGYKAGMVSVWVKDGTSDSLTKDKRIAIPATVLECPPMRLYAVRFYKKGVPFKDVVVAHDASLKKRIRLSKDKKIAETNTKVLDEVKEFDDVRALVYSGVKDIAVDKSTPDIREIALSGSSEEKLSFLKERIGKPILVTDVFSEGLVDTRAVTKGFGTQGPVKRFGISLKDHKSEKGRRRPGSLAPWHPARVTFRAPQAGQTGYHNRISYNNLILDVGSSKEKDINKGSGFDHYGLVTSDYLVLKGSVPGPKKRAILITAPLRPSKAQSKHSFEVLEVR